MRDSDGTVIFSLALALTGGSKKTVAFAIKHKKPWLHIYRDGQYDAAESLLRFIFPSGPILHHEEEVREQALLITPEGGSDVHPVLACFHYCGADPCSGRFDQASGNH